MHACLQAFLDLWQRGVQDPTSLVFSLEARDHDPEDDRRDGIRYLDDFDENFDFGDTLEWYRSQYGANGRVIGGDRFDLSLKPSSFFAQYHARATRVGEATADDAVVNAMMC